ncbi:MAG: hypothetical protein WBY53_11125 [Acidobacteriaceae bacterium]
MVLKRKLNFVRMVGRLLMGSLVVSGLLVSETRALATTLAAEPAQSGELRDGQHDFDFHFGTWHRSKDW